MSLTALTTIRYKSHGVLRLRELSLPSYDSLPGQARTLLDLGVVSEP